MNASIINIFNGNKQVFKEETKYMNIHSAFKSKKILNFVGDLIVNYGYKSFNDLSFDEQEEVAALLIEVDDPLEFISDTNQFMQSLSQMMNHHTIDRQDKFISMLTHQAVDYYQSIMMGIFNHVLEDYQSERKNWLDHAMKYGDPDEAYDRYFANLI